MARAIEETERRREKQLEFNKEHGITPQTVRKAVADIMEGAYPGGGGRGRDRKRGAKDANDEYAKMAPEQLAKEIDKLEKQMLKHARELEFEEAAKLRDQIDRISKSGLGLQSG